MVSGAGDWKELAVAHNAALRGRVFYPALLDRRKFYTSGERCRVCGRDIAPAVPGSEAGERGFVAPMAAQYEDLPVSHFHAWVCTGCFEQFESAMEWTRGEGEVPEIPRLEMRAFSRAWNNRSRAERNQKVPGECPYALTGWSVEHLVGLAKIHGYRIPAELAQRVLEE